MGKKKNHELHNNTITTVYLPFAQQARQLDSTEYIFTDLRSMLRSIVYRDRPIDYEHQCYKSNNIIFMTENYIVSNYRRFWVSD